MVLLADSECPDQIAQADPDLRGSHMPEDSFSHYPGHIQSILIIARDQKF